MASQTSSSSKHIFSVPRGVWIHANYVKPQFPASKWRGGERCSDCENLTKEGTDPYKALMAHCATPLGSSLFPAELLIRRKIRIAVPILPSQLEPSRPYLKQFREKNSALKPKQKKNFIHDTPPRNSQTSCQEILSGYPAKRWRGQW